MGAGPESAERRTQPATKSACAICVASDHGRFRCQSLVIASGGLAAPKLGASPFGYQVAEQFGLRVIPPKPALVPLALAPETLAPLEPLSGASSRRRHALLRQSARIPRPAC